VKKLTIVGEAAEAQLTDLSRKLLLIRIISEFEDQRAWMEDLLQNHGRQRWPDGLDAALVQVRDSFDELNLLLGELEW
jgi:hypothetical protein